MEMIILASVVLLSNISTHGYKKINFTATTTSHMDHGPIIQRYAEVTAESLGFIDSIRQQVQLWKRAKTGNRT